MNLPPTAALEALEALDQEGSVTGAASRLGLSQSAVSHKLRALEARLGFALTRPHGRGVVLTGQAQRYVEAVRPALDALRTAQVQADRAGGRLEVACASGFAATWLAPRIREFLRLHPEVTLRVRSTPAAGDGGTDDIAILFTDTPPEGARPLMEVAFFPVCSPAYFHGRGVPKAADLPGEGLLHLLDRSDWRDWLTMVGARAAAADVGTVFSDVLTMLAAAEAGQGICLGDALTCDAALGAGRLVRPYPEQIAVRAGYWIAPRHGAAGGAALAFIDWVEAALVR